MFVIRNLDIVIPNRILIFNNPDLLLKFGITNFNKRFPWANLRFP